MEAIRQTITIPASRNINIQLPETVTVNEEAEIIILFRLPSKKTYAEKIVELREATSDPLFLADLKEIAEDFKYTDQEQHL